VSGHSHTAVVLSNSTRRKAVVTVKRAAPTILRLPPAVDLHQGATATTRACSPRPCYEVGGWMGTTRFDAHWPIAKPAWVHDTVAEAFQS